MERTKTLMFTFIGIFVLLISLIWYHDYGSYEKTLIYQDQRNLFDEEAQEIISDYQNNKAYYVKERKQTTYTKKWFPLTFKKKTKILSSKYFSHD